MLYFTGHFMGFFLWRNSPARAYATSMLRFLDHTQLDTLTRAPGGLLWRSAQVVADFMGKCRYMII